jgi:hypothetical protein
MPADNDHQPCPPGAHNPLYPLWQDHWTDNPTNICSRCGRYIVFIRLVWIVDTTREGEDLKQ